ncbi:Putative peptidase C1-like protein [Durusdinium trenchii]|uniref:Peptidase C1-like protein n=1 Tax=Durusdinium trenchii TaxID=1381693 RepID=A0ABP0IT93_9DINO
MTAQLQGGTHLDSRLFGHKMTDLPAFLLHDPSPVAQVAPILIDAARQGLKKAVIDGKTFAPFGMLPHVVEPVKVHNYVPKASGTLGGESGPQLWGGGDEAVRMRIPEKVDLRQYMTTVEDQSQTNSCCANAVCGAYEYMGKRHAMQLGQFLPDPAVVDDISRLFIYYVGRKKDQPLGDDRPGDSDRASAVRTDASTGATAWQLFREELRLGEGDTSHLGREERRLPEEERMPESRHGVAPKDEGMSLGGAISALELKGACLEMLGPVYGSVLEEVWTHSAGGLLFKKEGRNWPFNISRVNERPPETCFNEAVRYKIAESRKVEVRLASMRQCLAEGPVGSFLASSNRFSVGHPIVFGLKLTAQFFKPAPGGGITTPDPSDPQSAEHGLHAMLIVGYNDRQEARWTRAGDDDGFRPEEAGDSGSSSAVHRWVGGWWDVVGWGLVRVQGRGRVGCGCDFPYRPTLARIGRA